MQVTVATTCSLEALVEEGWNDGWETKGCRPRGAGLL